MKIGFTYDENVPLTGCRRSLIRCSYRLCSYITLFFGGVIPIQEEIEFDYSHYLGPNYLATQSTKPLSTVVSNHCCWSDIMILITSKFLPSFAAKRSL